MGPFIQGADRRQATLLPEMIEDYVGEENPIRVARRCKLMKPMTLLFAQMPLCTRTS